MQSKIHRQLKLFGTAFGDSDTAVGMKYIRHITNPVLKSEQRPIFGVFIESVLVNLNFSQKYL